MSLRDKCWLPLCLLIALCLFAANATAESESPGTATWASAQAGSELPEQALLAIGLVALDAGTVAGQTSKQILALRRAEALYIPFLLRTVLENSRLWGAVRLLPSADASAELLITGDILESSGDRLAIHIRAVDSSGREWLNREYNATVHLDAYEMSPGAEPFLHLYEEITADLVRFRAELPLADLERIIEISRLTYAARLAPEAFSGYLKSDPDGRLKINRLPAVGDPMLARVDRTRETEYLFVDAVDLQFGQYFHKLAPTYTAWRRLTLESESLMDSYRGEASSRRSSKGKKSAARSYRELRELKLYQQTLREAIVSFEFEVSPTTLDLDGDLVQLSGSLAEQQSQWKSLLNQLYAAQLGLPLIPESAD